eukprot:scaffold69317_cov37-Tisochrysis_lutea.AAC.2
MSADRSKRDVPCASANIRVMSALAMTTRLVRCGYCFAFLTQPSHSSRIRLPISHCAALPNESSPAKITPVTACPPPCRPYSSPPPP